MAKTKPTRTTVTTRTYTQTTDTARHGRQGYKREDFLSDLRTVSQRISDQISAEPREAARLRKSRQQAKKGKRRPLDSESS
jgi:hypothetical protein